MNQLIEEVISYARKYRVSHFLLDTERYGPRTHEAGWLYEPFGSRMKALLSKVKKEDMALFKVPDEAILFRERTMILVDVERLADFAEEAK